MATLDDFFAEYTEQTAAADQEYTRTLLAQVDAARAANDWFTLKSLGYAQRIDGRYEGQYRWEFDQQRYNDDQVTLTLTPAQLAKRHNDAADW